ncbi:hypothetical protein [Paenibacillus sp. IHBB 10380]|uniref:hypothetical protein n=1 Tax=Paenibacillus sp. IHBB 10380 TaxID=1566358 RepID=UPI000A423DB6|nr:hypothetical protein [Paenibacillus sp. IHBB 10380]
MKSFWLKYCKRNRIIDSWRGQAWLFQQSSEHNKYNRLTAKLKRHYVISILLRDASSYITTPLPPPTSSLDAYQLVQFSRAIEQSIRYLGLCSYPLDDVHDKSLIMFQNIFVEYALSSPDTSISGVFLNPKYYTLAFAISCVLFTFAFFTVTAYLFSWELNAITSLSTTTCPILLI